MTDENVADFQFLGGAGTVTGSKYLLRVGSRRVLVDCGLFQGLKELRMRNRQTPGFNPKTLDAVVLSHAHIDHIGYLPLLVRQGFRGPVYCTGGTKSLGEILLPDAAHIQEEEANYANRKGFSKHLPALPLFTAEDARRALSLFQRRSYHDPFEVVPGVQAILRRAGHILGSATVELQLDLHTPIRWVFSGDLGRWGRPMLRDPEFVPEADILLIESTYGDRVHSTVDASEELARVVGEAAARGGALIIPAFAVGRTQELIWRLRELENAGRIPKLPIFIDSPMATDATKIFCQHPEDHDIDMTLLMDEHRCPLCCQPYTFTRTPEQSKALNQHPGPLIIIAASGMATAGRILHHLKRRLPDKRTTVLLAGFQAVGTRGRSLQEGARSIRIHGQNVPVAAHIATIDGLSAHADRNDLLRWFRGFEQPPRRVFVVHGEPSGSQSLASALANENGCHAAVAMHGHKVDLLK
jgi:metallo-beta-lactamase family protein